MKIYKKNFQVLLTMYIYTYKTKILKDEHKYSVNYNTEWSHVDTYAIKFISFDI